MGLLTSLLLSVLSRPSPGCQVSPAAQGGGELGLILWPLLQPVSPGRAPGRQQVIAQKGFTVFRLISVFLLQVISKQRHANGITFNLTFAEN